MNVQLLTYRNAPGSVLESGAGQLSKLIDPQYVTLVRNNADVLFFLTGGSERPAVESLTPGRFVCLVGSRRNNAYASATEVMAYIRNPGYPALLLDQDDPHTPELLMSLEHVLSGIRRLRGKRLGLIGEVSDWLVASSIPADKLYDVLGIVLDQISWKDVPAYATQAPDPSIAAAFAAPAQGDLAETSRVATALRTAVRTRSFDAITVECFSLVKGHCVTACLPLAEFNAEGFPAACEGDITSAAGMMLAKETTGVIPWMANINKIDEQSCLFSHCTIAPTLVENHSVPTHFETGMGTAVQGDFIGSNVTIFRLNNALTRAFIATGPIVAKPRYETACRTQIEVNLSPGAVRSLRENPLGNHHLIFPGNAAERLSLACAVLGIHAELFAG